MEVYTPLAPTTSLCLLKLDHLFLQTEHGEFEHVKLWIFAKTQIHLHSCFVDPVFVIHDIFWQARHHCLGLKCNTSRAPGWSKDLFWKFWLMLAWMLYLWWVCTSHTSSVIMPHPVCNQWPTHTTHSQALVPNMNHFANCQSWECDRRKLLCMFRIPGNTRQC